jgi:hypothetical protein
LAIFCATAINFFWLRQYGIPEEDPSGRVGGA